MIGKNKIYDAQVAIFKKWQKKKCTPEIGEPNVNTSVLQTLNIYFCST